MADEPNLFGVPRKAKARRRTAPAPSGAVQHLIGLHRAAYERRHGEPPVFTAKDGQLLKRLVAQFGAAKVEERLVAYHAWDDRFAVESGHSIGVFHSQWNRLAALVTERRRQDRTGGVPAAERTAEYIRNLKRGRDGR